MEGQRERGQRYQQAMQKKRNEIRHSKELEGKEGQRRGRGKSKDGKKQIGM